MILVGILDLIRHRDVLNLPPQPGYIEESPGQRIPGLRRAGADIISLGDDYAANNGPLFSPGLFEEFIQPRLKKIVDVIHEAGAKVIKHSDGNLSKILDKIVNTGIDGLNPIEPSAGMDIGEVKRKYGDRICLVRNIDCGDLLSHGSPEEVESAVIECICKASPGGGHILSSSNTIHSSVKPENYLTMIQAAKKIWKVSCGMSFAVFEMPESIKIIDVGEQRYLSYLRAGFILLHTRKFFYYPLDGLCVFGRQHSFSL